MSNYYTTCGVGGTTEDLLTTYIKLPQSVANVQVTAKYNVRFCDSFPVKPSPCNSEVKFLKKEQDNASPFPAMSDYALFKTETPAAAKLISSPPDNVPPKITSNLTVIIQKRGVYFAIKVQSACVTLFSFKVSYGICASEGINLMTFPETVSPPAGSKSINVTGACVKHAVSLRRKSLTPYAFCDGSGNWTAGVNISCVCVAGYRQNVILNTCEGKQSFPVTLF